MEARPKIEISLTHFDKIVEIGGIVLLILMWALSVFSYINSPGTVPTHFNLSGEPDRYGSKLIILVLPIIATIVYIGFTKLNKYPHIFNYLTKITTENAKTQYTIVTRLLRILKVSILLIFIIIILSSFLVTSGRLSNLGAWFLPFTILLLAIPILSNLSILKRVKQKHTF